MVRVSQWEVAMKAIVLHRTGGPKAMRYEDIETPRPGPGEVLVRVRAAGVNHVDIDIRKGASGMAGTFPHILGVDAAGEVAEIGDGVTQWKRGDRVAPHFILSCGVCPNCVRGLENMCFNFDVLGATVWGTYAEYVKVGQHHLVRLPDGLSFDDAVSSYVPFATAWEALVTTGHVAPGETVLVNAAGSGVGSAGIQVAKLAGARVIATAGSPGKLRKARELGADATIDYKKKSVAGQVMKLTGGIGVDVALDMVGGKVLIESIEALAQGGRLVTVGAHAGEKVGVDMIEFFRKHISMHGCGRSTKAIASEVLALVAAGNLKPVIHRKFKLKDVAKAHEIMESRKFFGRMVLNL
jgi:NADPH:quinone reductase-like Zn-dependent oxidoreductase